MVGGTHLDAVCSRVGSACRVAHKNGDLFDRDQIDQMPHDETPQPAGGSGDDDHAGLLQAGSLTAVTYNGNCKKVKRQLQEGWAMDRATGAARPRRGWADKREAIGRGARRVFARDGYARASIDAIALEAGVSTRTIYNHFGDKETLFTSVVTESSARVRDALIARTRECLDSPADLETSLIAVAQAWMATMEEFGEHFALIRLITSEANHFPSQAREAWQHTGPEAARAELARHFDLLIRQGLLTAHDPHRAAIHFHLLAFAEIMERSHQGAAALDKAEVNTIIIAGIKTFLRGHLPR